MENIYKKLREVKKELGVVRKDKTNPFHKSKYADINTFLEVVEPVLEKHGLLLLQPIENDRVYTIIQDPDSDTRVLSFLQLPSLNDPQKTGGCITYYRRYGLQSLLALQAEDDDGNLASGKGQEVKPISSPKPVKSIYKYNVGSLLKSQDFLDWVDANGLSLEEEMSPNGTIYTAIISKKPLAKIEKYEVK